MPTIGLLLPRSSFYQTIGFDIYEGLRSALKLAGHDDVKIITENIGFGADKQNSYRCAEKLVLEENASIVIAFIGHRTAQLLRPLFLAANKLLIVLDAGANMPQEWSECPNIFYHSLHNSLGAWLTAKLAVKKGFTTAGVVTGYYDGGYLHMVGLFNGFEHAGGKICFNHAVTYKKEEFTMLPLKDRFAEFPDAALLTVFSIDFLQTYLSELKNTFGEQHQVPVFLTPLGLEESMLDDAEFAGTNIKGVAAWSRHIASPQNKLFIDTIEEAGKTPNLFSLLGWEAASIALRALELVKEHKNKVKEIADALKLFEFESPRGKICFNAKSNTSLAPMYEVSVVRSENNKFKLQIDAEITNTSAAFDELLEQPLNEVTSAWYNTYLCI